MAKRRPTKKKSQGEIEAELLSKGRWSGLKQNDAIQAVHGAGENRLARNRCRRLVDGEYTSFEELWGRR